MKKISARTIVEPAIFAAVISLLAPFSVPIGPVPLSLATFAIYLTGGLLKPVKATAAVCVYLLIGIVGLPVFSGFSGGLEKIVSPTGGFLLGYIPCVLTISCMMFISRKMYMYPLAIAAGTVLLYACGLCGFMLQSGRGFYESLSVTVLPFIFTDIIKITAASAVCIVLYKRVFEERL